MKQKDALVDAGIIPREPVKQTTQDGMGAFDVAWLNSRSKDVGREKEKELVTEAKAWLEKMEAKEKDDVMEE
jgi:hypothetical protein